MELPNVFISKKEVIVNYNHGGLLCWPQDHTRGSKEQGCCTFCSHDIINGGVNE